MLLNNFYRYLTICSGVNAQIVNNAGTTIDCGCKPTDSNYYAYCNIANIIGTILTSKPGITSANTGWVLGTGSTPVNANDYWLSGSVISNFTYTAASAVSVTGGYSRQIIITATSDITISEIGLVFTAQAFNNNSNMLVFREVITPITINSGDSATLNFSFTGTQLP